MADASWKTTSDRIKKGLTGASLPFIIRFSNSLAAWEASEVTWDLERHRS
ncbi:hypothetical protein [Myxosarcina sp. GI1(2024)]